MTTMLTITTKGPHTGAAALRRLEASVFAAGSLFVAGVILLPFSRRSKKWIGLLSLACLACLAILFVAGCGGSSVTTPQPTPTATPAGTYTVAVTATAGNGSQTQSFTLTVTP